MTTPVRLTTNAGFTSINDGGGQSHGSPPQMQANSDAQRPQDASSTGTLVGTVTKRRYLLPGILIGEVKTYREATNIREGTYRETTHSSNLADRLLPDSFLRRASVPLLATQTPVVGPRTPEEYCQHWDAWKNEAHPSGENRTEAVKRMKELVPSRDPETGITSGGGPGRTSSGPSSRSSTLDLSSLGLSSLPTWLPKARKVNLDNNRLTSFPTDSLTHLTDTSKRLGTRPEIRLTNNPLTTGELNRLQSIKDSSGYEGPQLILPRPGQSYEPPQIPQGMLT